MTEDDGTVRVAGGRARLHAGTPPLDLGNSGTGMRLFAGVVAGLEGTTVLTGDTSLTSRPMDRVAEPLEVDGGDGVRPRGRRLPRRGHRRTAASHRLPARRWPAPR